MSDWTLRGDRETYRRFQDELDRAATTRESAVGERSPGVFLKYGPLRGNARLRHGLRRWVPGLELPRLNEYENLAWLRREGFGAPEPLVAGVRFEGGWPAFQFLITRKLAGLRGMREFLSCAPDPARSTVLVTLARDLSRLHRSGFVHRDLFPRNLLVDGTGERVSFLDAWRGGPRPGLRGPSYDLACWMLYGADLLEPGEQRLWFETYCQARPVPARTRGRLIRQVVRQRQALCRKLARRPARLAHLPPPSPDWEATAWM